MSPRNRSRQSFPGDAANCVCSFGAGGGGVWMESPSPGTSRHPWRWVWHGLFITGAPDRSICHSLGTGVGGLRAPMGAEDLGLPFRGVKGDLVKSKPLGTAAAPQPGQRGCRQRASLPGVPGSPLATGSGCKSGWRAFSRPGGGFSRAWTGLRGLARLTAPFLRPSNPSPSAPLELDQLWAADAFPVAQRPKVQQNSCFL